MSLAPLPLPLLPIHGLFVSMLQRMGIKTDKFASATGTMQGMEMV